jgi:hypothetical protein
VRGTEVEMKRNGDEEEWRRIRMKRKNNEEKKEQKGRGMGVKEK